MPTDPDSSPNHRRPVTSDRRPLRRLSYLLVAVALVGCVAFYLSHHDVMALAAFVFACVAAALPYMGRFRLKTPLAEAEGGLLAEELSEQSSEPDGRRSAS